MLADFPGAKLLFVGDGVLRPEIERAASGVADALHITGWVPDAGPWFKLMGVYALTSRFEGMPLSLIEAACQGLRIAAVSGPGVAAVLRRAEWAVAVPSRDPAVLAQGLRTALSLSPAPDRLLATRSYFSVARMARDVVRVYEAAQRKTAPSC